jgi:hypothetical protein
MNRNVPPVHVNNVQLPQEADVKYLGLHLDKRLTWFKTFFTNGNNWELPHQNVLFNWKGVKSFHKQQTSHI